MFLSMAKRVTLKDIAQKAKVHFTTVSLALKNDPRLPEQTRKRLQKLADEMGYVPDAAMKALCAYRQTNRPHPIRTAMAYLTDMPQAHPLSRFIYNKAREKAASIGYNLIESNLGESNTTLPSCMRVWRNMGIKGVVIGPFLDPEPLAEGSWDSWVTVAIGYTVERPQFNRVVPDLFHNLLEHFSILRRRGYERIGLLLYGNFNTKIYGILHGAYLLDQARHGSTRMSAHILSKQSSPPLMRAWIEKKRLDAVVAPLEDYPSLLETGLRIPDDIGFSLLAYKPYDPNNPKGCSGMNLTLDNVAANAVSYLASQLHENDFGIPDRPKCLLVPGVFEDGSSIRQEPQLV